MTKSQPHQDATGGATRRAAGEDPSRMIAEITPGKKGGDFELPFGGNITIPPSCFGKKDVVTCCMVVPGSRHKYLPPLGQNEKLLTEILLFSTSSKSLKKPLTMTLHHYQDNFDLRDIVLLVKRVEDENWAGANFNRSDADTIQFAVHSAGVYVALSVPRTDHFDVPALGCLYAAKISKQISVRFPKKATDVDMTCDIQIHPLNWASLVPLRREHPHDMSDLITASDFIDIRPSEQKEFRRPLTVKLPLPHLDTDEFSLDDMAVMQLTQNGWDLVEANLKFTKATVSFETRTLSRYCVALANPQRRKRLKEAFKHIEHENRVSRGHLVAFLHVQEKAWTLWVECAPNDRQEQTVEKRLKQGFRRVTLSETPKVEDEKPAFRRSWRSRANKPKEEQEPKRTDLDLVNGDMFDLEVSGDLRVAEEDTGKHFMGLHFHERLPENYRKFLIEPITIQEGEYESVSGVLSCYVDSKDGDSQQVRKCVRTFELSMDAEEVRDYFWVEPEPEPEPEPVRKEEPVYIPSALPGSPPPPSVEREPTPPPEVAPKPTVVKATPISASFLRLTQLRKPPRQVIRESKVLTGKSLMILAREVEQGLTLAIYLDLNDSTITGMGFDALAKGLSLIDITYRILMLWKRRTSKFKDTQVDLLVRALQEMGRYDVAAVVLQKHRENVELTPECFAVLQL